MATVDTVTLAQSLSKFDSNGDGLLSEESLVAILTRSGGASPLPEADARAWFAKLCGGADKVPMTALVAAWSGAVTGLVVKTSDPKLPPARVRNLFKKVRRARSPRMRVSASLGACGV